MTTLPSNLALVGEDLAQATTRDWRRSVRRRRRVALAVAFALLALTASAAIATGWLSDKTPATKAVQSLDASASPGATRVLLSNLGSEQRTLSADATPGGAVCLTLSGFSRQCIPTLLARQQISFFVWSTTGTGGPALIWGIARDSVRSVDAVSADGQTTRAQLANDAFFVELSDGLPVKLVANLADGSSVTRPISPCPPTNPVCVP